MTREEMSGIFALMLLAWPNAPMLRPENQEATISLWTLCLPEVDFLTGQMAMIELCRTCHYPPSIAQMREAAEKVKKRIHDKVHANYYILRFQAEHDGTPFHWEEIKEARRRKLLEKMTRTAETLQALQAPDDSGADNGRDNFSAFAEDFLEDDDE